MEFDEALARLDALLNYETVKLFACEQAEAARFEGLTQQLARLQVRRQGRRPHWQASS